MWPFATISLMQAEKVRSGHFPKHFTLVGRDIALHPIRNMRSSRFPIHLLSDDDAYRLWQRFPMLQSEGIGVA
jgi:hypothetical protein